MWLGTPAGDLGLFAVPQTSLRARGAMWSNNPLCESIPGCLGQGQRGTLIAATGPGSVAFIKENIGTYIYSF